MWCMASSTLHKNTSCHYCNVTLSFYGAPRDEKPTFRSPDAASISPFVDGNITDDEIPPQQQTLRLAAVPDDTNHVFTVTIELDDGAFYEFVSPTVVFDLEE